MEIRKNFDYKFGEDEFLWKYLDLHRLLYFLSEECIFFNQLKKFDDFYEGFGYTNLFDELRIQTTPDTQDINPLLPKEVQEEILNGKELAVQRLQIIDKVQSSLYASCWFLCESESYAMWNLYSNEDAVVLRLKANYLRDRILMRSQLVLSKEIAFMLHGKVSYAKVSPFDPTDYRFDEIKKTHTCKGFVKDVSFSHEKEFRFIAAAANHLDTVPEQFILPIGPLNDLEFKIICHPYMDDWKVDNLKKILQKFNLNIEVCRSSLPKKRR